MDVVELGEDALDLLGLATRVCQFYQVGHVDLPAVELQKLAILELAFYLL